MWFRSGAVAGSVVMLALLLAPAATARPRDDLRQYAQRTWDSFVAMTDSRSGLPADILNRDGSTSVQTSTTNIGAYMWSAVAARRLGIISRRTLVRRLSRTVTTLEHMERYAGTGQYYNWYDHRTGAKLTDWPPKHDPNFHPILSSVDNGWLAVGLKIVHDSVPELSRRAGTLYDAMDFGFYYRPDVNRVLFHFRPDDPAASPCCYDTVVSESRIVDYLGLAKGQLPQKEYFGRWRTFPDTCDYNFQETRPIGTWRTYFGVDVFEGAYPYAGMRLVPSWGGSMFEALMPALFVPEERWAPESWGATTRSPCERRSTTACARRATATGASPPPTSPRANTARGESTAPAWIPTACRPTRTARSSTTAGTIPPARAPPRPTRPLRRTRTAS